MPNISFIKQGRTGNLIFQYLITKVIGFKFDYVYVPLEQIINDEDVFMITEDNIRDILSNDNYDFFGQRSVASLGVFRTQELASDGRPTQLLSSKVAPLPENFGKNIICRGFFQNSDFFIPYRQQLIETLKVTDDYWINDNGKSQYISDFFQCQHKQTELAPNDIVVSLRLDDFIQLPCPTSDIIPPEYYLNIIDAEISKQVMEGNSNQKLYIVCDSIRYEWERRYIDFFQKWNPILLQEDIMHDCALMRDCSILLHSNSTMCWIMSFFSETKMQRYIPNTNFYKSQSLNKIENTDILTEIAPLTHHDVYNVHLHTYLKSSIFPLSYCIPDEYIVGDEVLHNKTSLIAPLIPGDTSTYVFGPDQEEDYRKMYQSSMFACTRKKGGWDCMRHYEILGNGCIPIFQDLHHCPPTTLTTLPKELIMEANEKLFPWNFNNKSLYDEYWKKIMTHVRDNCSASSTTNYFMDKIGFQPNNVLLIMGNCGINYTRETFWIGMKRYIQQQGGTAVEYPKMDFMYDTYSEPNNRLYGNGFTYSRKLKDDYHGFSENEIVDKIKNKYFDLIIYGKVGPDEGHEGTLPMLFWDHIHKRYTRNEIVFLYGGDECIDMTNNNRYSQHIIHHSQFAKCFVREHKI